MGETDVGAPGAGTPGPVRSLVERLRVRAWRLLRRLHPGWGLRDDDVLLASFPKSGNSWVRFLWANVVALEELDGRTVDFHVLDRELGSEYDTGSWGRVEFSCLPRLVKTHARFDERAFGDLRSVYLLRQPGDVMVSAYHYHRARRSGSPPPEDFGAFLRDEELGLPAWCRHVRSWLGRATLLLRYEELRRDAARALERVLAELGHEAVSRETLGEAARRSSFASLRRLEEERGRPRERRFEPDYRFLRQGGSGEWRSVFDERQAAWMEEVLEAHGLAHLPELAAGGDGAR